MSSTKSTLLALISLSLTLSLPTTLAVPHTHDHSDHDHVARGKVPPVMLERGWSQDSNSPTARMFLDRRAANGDVGSAGWVASYPPAAGTGVTPDTSLTPQAWTDRFNTLYASSSFPKNYEASNLNGGYPTYPNGLSGTDPSVCSFTYQCTDGDDLWESEDGTLAIAFDDGPTSNSGPLYDFLGQNNISATHFMIGSNILYQTDLVTRAFNENGHLAVHTWSHPYMTTRTNAQVIAELGWTMQIITDVTGYVPAFWRPPYGDVDNRVRMIAAEVFGMRTVPWNRDSGDWAIGNNPAYTMQSVEATFTGWLTGSKSPGLVILEHELNPNTIGVFEAMYPLMLSNGWKVGNVAEIFEYDWYQNAANNSMAATNQTSILQTNAPGNYSEYLDTLASQGYADDAVSTSTSSSSSSSSTSASTSMASSSATTSAAGLTTTRSVTPSATAQAATTSSTSDALGGARALGGMVAVGAGLVVGWACLLM